MGVGVSRSNLAGAVAAEGGIGIISTAQIGYDEEGFEKDQAGCNRIAIRKHIHRAKEIAEGKGLVGVNIMVALKHYKEHVQEAVRAGADVIISGAGLPMDLPKLVGNNKTKIAPIVSSRRATQLILKMWAHRYNRTADFIVIEGPKAGGHLGFSRDQLENLETLDYDHEIREIIACKAPYEEKYGTKIPVIVAGGIFDRADIDHMTELGADGVQIASRFVATEECDASDAYKNDIYKREKERYSNYSESGRYAGTCHYESLHAARHGRRKDPAQSLPPLPCQMFPRRDPLLHYRQADRRRKGRRGKRPAVLRSKGLYGR